MKDFESFLNEAAIAAEHTSNRVEIDDIGNRVANLSKGKYQIGAITFGSSSIARELIIDNNIEHDQKLAGTNVCARIGNSLTTIQGGFVNNATLAKFNLKTGVMWLAEDEDEYGNIVWGRPFKFKKMVIQQLDLAVKLGWVW